MDEPEYRNDATPNPRVSGVIGETLRAWSAALEEESRLDRLAGALDAAGRGLTARRTASRALRGEWLGHALHPLMTDFPLGAWLSTSLLDLFGGKQARRSAEMLLGFGIAAAVPTVVTGFAEVPAVDPRSRRVAAVHASVNGTALALYSASLAARKRRRHGLAAVLGVAGGVAATVGGYIGGHLSLVRGAGVERVETQQHRNPNP